MFGASFLKEKIIQVSGVQGVGFRVHPLQRLPAKVLLWLIEGHGSRKRLLAAGPSKLKPPKFGV